MTNRHSTFLLGPSSYQRPAQAANICVLILNTALLALDIVLRDPIALLPAALIIWYCARVLHQNSLRRQQKRLQLRANTARLEQAVFGRTYEHDWSYLEGNHDHE